MVLLNGLPWTAPPYPVLDARSADEFFIEKQTKAVYRDYPSYLQALQLLKARVWGSISTGAGNLTFEEAARADTEWSELGTKVPTGCVEAALRLVEGSTASLSDLTSNILDVAQCFVPSNGKENKAYQHSKNTTPSQAHIRSWICQVAAVHERDGTRFWKVRPEIGESSAWHGSQHHGTAGISYSDNPAGAASTRHNHAVAEQSRSQNDGTLQPEQQMRHLHASAPEPHAKQKRVPKKRLRLAESETTMGEAEHADANGEVGTAGGVVGVANGDAVETAAEPAEVPRRIGPARSLEEEQAKLKPGTHKAAAFEVLRVAGPEGLTVQETLAAGRNAGLKDWDDSSRRMVQFALSTDEAFVRVAKRVYALHAFHPTLQSTFVPAHNKRPRKTEGPRNVEQTQPQAGPSHAENEMQNTASSHLAANGVFVGQQSQQPDFEAQEGQDWADRNGSVSESPNGRTLGQPEMSALEKAQQDVWSSQMAVSTYQEQLAQSMMRVEMLQKRAQESEVRSKERLKAQEAVQVAEEMPDFSPSEEELAFTGDPDDRRAVMAHRRKSTQLQAAAEAKRSEWVKAQRKKEAKGRSEVGKESGGLRRQLKAAENKATTAQAALAQAERDALEATRSLEREQGRMEKEEARAKEREEREAARAAEREERERKRLEALAAKRYPIDDLELLQELSDRAVQCGEELPACALPAPEAMLPELADLTTNLLYISDFTSQFKEWLRLSPMNFRTLSGAVRATASDATTLSATAGAHGSRADTIHLAHEPHEDAAAQDGDADSDEAPVADRGTQHPAEQHQACQRLQQLFEELLRAVLQDSPLEKRWKMLLQAGTWPEVLRRYAAHRAQKEADKGLPDASAAATAAAALLARKALQELPAASILELLRFLCDEALDTERIRNVLGQRMEEADGLKKDIREEIAGDKRKLRELMEAEREERRQKKEAEQKKKEELDARLTQLQQQQLQETTDGVAVPSRQPSLSLDSEDEEAMPNFELPADLQDYGGDPHDRKAMLGFRQIQQTARQRLEAEKSKWLAESRKRAKAREAARREQAEKEKHKERERASAEEAIIQRQEQLDKEMDRFLIRRNPLGSDRFFRRYWWGVGGHNAQMFVEDDGGAVGAWDLLSDIEELDRQLDRRGIREHGLKAGLQKAWPSIQRGLTQSHTGQDIETQGQAGKSKKHKVSPESADDGAAQESQDISWQEPSLARTHQLMFDLTQLAADAGLQSGSGNWKDARPSSAEAAELHSSCINPSQSVAAVQETRTRLLRLEQLLYAASPQVPLPGAEAASETSNDSHQEEQQEESAADTASMEDDRLLGGSMNTTDMQLDNLQLPSEGRTGRPTSARIWSSAQERLAWNADLEQAMSLAHVAYDGAVLHAYALPYLKSQKRSAETAKGAAAARVAEAAEAAIKAAEAEAKAVVAKAEAAAKQQSCKKAAHKPSAARKAADVEAAKPVSRRAGQNPAADSSKAVPGELTGLKANRKRGAQTASNRLPEKKLSRPPSRRMTRNR
ncbi:hypothetical protein WJX74_011107 [Apatococcus lobatus]|uniref:WAC domain-containing protein n=1 Tax=Apatococcus lobatus TaxID=904363 RepID=A0AAW1SB89_9CHLO